MEKQRPLGTRLAWSPISVNCRLERSNRGRHFRFVLFSPPPRTLSFVLPLSPPPPKIFFPYRGLRCTVRCLPGNSQRLWFEISVKTGTGAETRRGVLNQHPAVLLTTADVILTLQWVKGRGSEEESVYHVRNSCHP